MTQAFFIVGFAQSGVARYCPRAAFGSQYLSKCGQTPACASNNALWKRYCEIGYALHFPDVYLGAMVVARPAPFAFSPDFVPGSPHVIDIRIELRQALLSYQDYHMLSLPG